MRNSRRKSTKRCVEKNEKKMIGLLTAKYLEEKENWQEKKERLWSVYVEVYFYI
jgi:hypothetical protein